LRRGGTRREARKLPSSSLSRKKGGENVDVSRRTSEGRHLKNSARENYITLGKNMVKEISQKRWEGERLGWDPMTRGNLLFRKIFGMKMAPRGQRKETKESLKGASVPKGGINRSELDTDGGGVE